VRSLEELASWVCRENALRTVPSVGEGRTNEIKRDSGESHWTRDAQRGKYIGKRRILEITR